MNDQNDTAWAAAVDQTVMDLRSANRKLSAKLAAIQRECEQVVFRKDPMAETRGTFARRLLSICEGRGE